MSAESQPQGSGPVGDAPDLERVEEGLARRSSELVAAARRVRTGGDPEAIHDLRVATRRLTAALRAWESLMPAKAGRGACDALRRLRRRVGRARELEVHVALAESRRPDAGANPRVVDTILERLHERLARRRRAAMKRVSPRRLKRLMGRVEAATAGVRERGRNHPGATAEALAVERGNAERAGVALRSAARRPDDVTLHEARLRVKQWRYLLECLEEAMPDAPWQAAEPLRRIQTLLGDIHDRALLRDVFARHALRPIPEAEREHLDALITTLDKERERAVRRFQRRALAEIEDDAPRPGPESIAVVPPRVAPPGEPAGDPPAEDAEPGGAPDREQRWGRMASWLEKSGDRS